MMRNYNIFIVHFINHLFVKRFWDRLIVILLRQQKQSKYIDIFYREKWK